MTSYNTGTTAKVTNNASPAGTITIPAGVLPGDIIYIAVMVFSTAAGTLTATLSSPATAPVAVGPQQATGVIAGVQVTTGIWSVTAGASDPGAALTFGATGGAGGAYWVNAGLVSYTSAANTGPTDVQGGNKEGQQGATSGNITTPALTTVTAGDWQIQIVAGGPASGFDFSPVPPAGSGLTLRQSVNHTGNAGLLLYIADGNGSAGPAGTGIGGTAWTGPAVGAATNVMTSFTIGLAPPAPSGGTQDRHHHRAMSR